MRESATMAAAARAREVSAGREVAARRTPLSTAEIRGAVGAAYGQVFGRPASDGALRVLTAHVSLETARGQRMFNYNFGGIKGASPEGTAARYQTHEVFAGKRVKLEQTFRAYSTAESGAADYLNLLRRRFPDAVEAAERGDAREFAERLGRAGYFTAPAGEYAAAMERLFGYPGGPPPPPPPPDTREADAARVAAAERADRASSARAESAAAKADAAAEADAARRPSEPSVAQATSPTSFYPSDASQPLDGAELALVLDALAIAGAARIAAPEAGDADQTG